MIINNFEKVINNENIIKILLIMKILWQKEPFFQLLLKPKRNHKRRKSLARIFWNISPTERNEEDCVDPGGEREGGRRKMKKDACFRQSVYRCGEFNSGAEFSFFKKIKQKVSH